MQELMMFSEQFIEQDSFEINYKGTKVNAFYTFDRIGSYILRFTFISKSSPYNQAIMIHLSSFKGVISINGEEIKKTKKKFPQLVFAENNTPKQFELKVLLEGGEMYICNGSDPLGTGEIWHSLSFGCAMIIEKLEDNHYRCRCNDHENDDDFEDLVFELEIFNCV